MANILMCIVGILVGVYTFVRHLNGFNRAKTVAVDAWLVCVGIFGWGMLLYANLDFDKYVPSASVNLVHGLFLAYWVGDNLKIQHHCLRYRKKLRKVNQ